MQNKLANKMTDRWSEIKQILDQSLDGLETINETKNKLLAKLTAADLLYLIRVALNELGY